MGYKTWVLNEVPTATQFNDEFRDQVISRFASEAARTSAVSLVVPGQYSAINSNNVGEGLYHRTSAGTWRRPWNMPWGLQVIETLAANSGTYSGATDILYAGFTVVANRRLQVVSQLEYQTSAANDIGRHFIRDATAATNLAGVVAGDFFPFNSGTAALVTQRSIVVSPAAGARTWAIQSQRAAGTGNLTAIGSAGGGTTFLAIIDIGPSGAPT